MMDDEPIYNPLELQLNEKGIATDLDELRELAHHAARGFLEAVMTNPFLGMMVDVEFIVANMSYLHDITCPTKGGVEHWKDFSDVVDRKLGKESTPGTPVKPAEEHVELDPVLERQLRQLLGGE